MYKWQPKDRNELINIINKEIVINQNKLKNKLFKNNYIFGLKDIDTSLVTNMSYLFTYINKIDLSDPRNNITAWNVSRVTNMSYMFEYSDFNQDISNWDINRVINLLGIFYDSDFDKNLDRWILKLNINCNLNDFNKSSKHREKFGTINSYKDFLKNHLTKDFIKETLQNGNDKEKYQLLKIFKNYPYIIKHLDIDRELL